MATSPYEGLYQADLENRQAITYLKENPWARKDGGLIVNAGIAKEAYFDSIAPGRFFTGLNRLDRLGNAPAEQFDATQLWRNSLPAKGMFATSDITSPTYVDPRGSAYRVNKFKRWAFQFHYNPTTVQMAYASNPDFDITMFTSGRDAFNLLGTATTQSTISFNLVLNRLHDMKYLTSSRNGRFDPRVTRERWSGRLPTEAEQRDIYKKGTMYDLEFFLRAVMQVEIPAALGRRNSFDNVTADMGFLTGIPVDLHLGDSLRYWVRVDGFNLTHVIFNERMVPLFTEVSITCSRIPDYRADYGLPSTSRSSKNTPPTAPQTQYELAPENFSGTRVSGIPTDYPENATLNEEYARYWADYGG